MATSKITKLALPSTLEIKSNLYENDDLDNYHGTGKSGIYYIGNNVQNAPVSYAAMLVISREGDTGLAAQLIITNDGCYTR